MSALLALVLLAAASPDKPAGIVGASDPCTIERVVDGDTTDVLIRGKSERLRLLAMDTEESWPSSSKPVTPFGLETSKWAKGFITDGDACWVEYGPERRDVYDRMLAYLWRKDGATWKMYNLEAVERGYSPYFTKYGYSDTHHDEFVAAQKNAQKAKKGLWDPANAADLRGTYLGSDGLLAWWNERADALKAFGATAAKRADIFDTRAHWPEIKEHAGSRLIVFTSIRNPDEKGADWAGKAEGKLYEPFELVAAGGNSDVEHALQATVGKYRYFTGTVELKDDQKTLQLTIESVADISVTPPAVKPAVKKASK